MNVLITGADGFIGQNLRAALQQTDHRLFLIDVNSSYKDLTDAAESSDFVFHLAGVNRPKDETEFQTGNADFTAQLLNALESGKRPPVVISSSTQAKLDNPYGKSKLEAEKAMNRYQNRTKSPVYIYRLTNVFGKWSRPNYNSAVATFCYNLTRNLPITISDPEHTMRLVYIDDVVAEFLCALDGTPTYNELGECVAGPEYDVTLKKLAALLNGFRSVRTTLDLPDQRSEFVRKLFATYQSFIPPDQLAYTPLTHADERGSFTELLHMQNYGQISVNVTRPGVTKGSHWHQTKHEKFVVVSGSGVIRFRHPFGNQTYTYTVNATTITMIDVPPGYVHMMENTGQTDMVTIMWASEIFDPRRPDTYYHAFEDIPSGDEEP